MEDHLWLKRFIIRITKEFIQQIKELCGQPWAMDISAPRCELSLRVHHSYLSTFKHCQIPNLAKQSTQVLLTCLESRLWIKGGVEAYYLSRWSVETAKLARLNWRVDKIKGGHCYLQNRTSLMAPTSLPSRIAAWTHCCKNMSSIIFVDSAIWGNFSHPFWRPHVWCGCKVPDSWQIRISGRYLLLERMTCM